MTSTDRINIWNTTISWIFIFLKFNFFFSPNSFFWLYTKYANVTLPNNNTKPRKIFENEKLIPVAYNKGWKHKYYIVDECSLNCTHTHIHTDTKARERTHLYITSISISVFLSLFFSLSLSAHFYEPNPTGEELCFYSSFSPGISCTIWTQPLPIRAHTLHRRGIKKSTDTSWMKTCVGQRLIW